MIELFIPEKEFFSIGEVSKITGLPSYTLRYWETEFSILRPARRVTKHRKYTKKDIERVAKIQELLHKKKYTIEGAKKALVKEEKEKHKQLNLDFAHASAAVSVLKEIKKDIGGVLERLKN